ncbi:olfactory receptor 2B6-like [Spea bombifrons]|uniref:olfactory receptor 2B6-like n=1 Tax=Spea bombifrons TaxID=233779 RepID=UPI00234B8573|nr:olfactory receptor 2B6-like [Spea bombifrons]
MDQGSVELFSTNKSQLTAGFILLGFADLPWLHYPLLVSFYLVYTLTIAGNILILALVSFSSSLHSPMYFFLCNLAVLDICYTTVTLPKLIQLHSGEDKTISFAGCISQQYFYISLAISEYFLLAAMAYDRYVAICSPLQYPVIMNFKLCHILAIGCWLTGVVTSSVPVSFSLQFVFCDSRIINHFFCDLTALLKLSCSKTTNIQAVIFTESVLLGLLPFLFTLSSYVSIVNAILSIHSSRVRYKTFSTCASHLTVVILFYGTMIGVYMRPSSRYLPAHDKLFALLYTAVIPMLNPMIYTLRNGEVKNTLKKWLRHHYSLKLGQM